MEKQKFDRNKLDTVGDMFIDIALGKFKRKVVPYCRDEEYVAIVQGLNMLSEELNNTTIAKNYYQSIIKGIADITIILYPDFSIKSTNKIACQQLLFEESELQGKPFAELLSNTSGLLKEVKELLYTNGDYHQVEHELKTKGGEDISVLGTFSLLYDNVGEVKDILYIAKDITYLKKVEQLLRKKNDDFNTLVYKSTHDLRAPLCSIKGLMNLAREQTHQPEEIEQYLRMIDDRVEKMDDIVKELVLFTSITQNKVIIEDIDAEQLLNTLLQQLKLTRNTDNITFNIYNKLSTPFRNDVTLVGLIFTKLIENAVIYSSRDKKRPIVSIRISELKKGIKIKVSDNGVGIPDSAIGNIYDMFFKASRNSTGSGLGLFLVRTSVEKLNGSITVKSKEQLGTTFTVELPHYFK